MSIKQAIEALPPLPEPAVNDHPSKSWHSFTAEQMREYALAALRSMPAEPANSVKMPTGEDEAALMVLTGVSWLKYNAPHRLKQPDLATPHTEAVRMSEAEIDAITKAQWGEQIGAMYAAYRAYARAVEQATFARLGVKMGVLLSQGSSPTLPVLTRDLHELDRGVSERLSARRERGQLGATRPHQGARPDR